jgi:hypothetical protein
MELIFQEPRIVRLVKADENDKDKAEGYIRYNNIYAKEMEEQNKDKQPIIVPENSSLKMQIITNIPFNITEVKLKNIFENCGDEYNQLYAHFKKLPLELHVDNNRGTRKQYIVQYSITDNMKSDYYMTDDDYPYYDYGINFDDNGKKYKSLSKVHPERLELLEFLNNAKFMKRYNTNIYICIILMHEFFRLEEQIKIHFEYEYWMGMNVPHKYRFGIFNFLFACEGIVHIYIYIYIYVYIILI